MTEIAVTGHSRRLIAGWGRTAPVTSDVVVPEDYRNVADVVGQAEGSVIARGLGRSYGDAAQVAGGTTIDLTRCDRILGFDATTGVVDVEAGVSIDHLIRTFVPKGWFVPVTPGTRYVTVGGAIASDVHGKNHHAVGSFGQHVVDLTVVTGAGTVLNCSPESEPELFWATVAGMGLTGVITRARVQLQPIESSLIKATNERAANLDDVMSRMMEIDKSVPYTVAWVDSLAKGSRFGRGLISHGDHAVAADTPGRADPLAMSISDPVAFPINLPSRSLNKLSLAAFNELWFRKTPKTAAAQLTSMASFFHPLDMVGDWNRIYGAPGFLQYQFVVPDSGSELIGRALRTIAATGGVSFLTVLKRFGPGNQAPLSFPMTGWTLALDIPARVAGLGRVLDRLDEEVADAGGRIYFTKDSRLRPDLVDKMYPQLRQWQAVRDRYDPSRRMQSDLATRLGI
ncbi:MAG: FAD-binding oxidoreductase [Candidatus Nanopelagicales bacterium]